MQKVSTATTTAPHASPAAAAAPARRERKKRQTRDALVQAALTLFDAQGFEHTAVREITDAVDVSTRTFFRHFESKEDLVVSFAREFSADLVRELAARPPQEEPLAALHAAFAASVRAVSVGEGYLGGKSVYLMIVNLVESTSSLLAAYLRHLQDHEDELVRVLAWREGVDPATDLRPRIATAIFSGVVATAIRKWRAEGGTSAEDIIAAFDACLEQVTPALAGHWTTR